MSTKIPKYFHVYQEIVAAIRQGRFSAGAMVPSENSLIKTYGVSNTTARKVLLELERAGWVTRVKGRGTYVRDNRVDRSANRILAFTKNMLEVGREPSTRLISVKVRKSAPRLRVNGRQYSLAGPVCEIKRLRLGDGIPMMRETRYVSEKLCPGIHGKDLEGSLYDIYEREYGLQLAQIEQVLSATMIDGRKMGFAELKVEIPAFYVQGVTFCAKELILEMEESIYRGDMYRFSVRATR